MNTYDAPTVIRHYVDAYGCDCWPTLIRYADDCTRMAAIDRQYPTEQRRPGFTFGGPRLAAEGERAAKRYRLAAWVLRQVQEGRDVLARAQTAVREAREAARILAPVAPLTPRDAFHKHLDACNRCRNEPFNLCLVGAPLLQAAALESMAVNMQIPGVR